MEVHQSSTLLIATAQRDRRGKDEGGGRSTKNELLGRGEHVKGEGDFILVALALKPAEEGRSVEHRRNDGAYF